MHLIRHATVVTISEKNASNAPVMIAPITLVAANVIAKRTIDVKIAPSIPTKITDRLLHTHPDLRITGDTASNIARYTTAMPKTTHKNAGVTVITALNCRNAVIIPIIILATMARPAQSLLQVQQKLAIYCHLQ